MRVHRVIMCVCAVSLIARMGSAASLAAGGGYDYYSGPGNQNTNSALALATLGFGEAGNVTAVGLRYDDTIVGRGFGVLGGAGLKVGPTSTLRVLGTRFVGDDSFRAWRLKAGPEIALAPRGTLGLSYVHYRDNTDGASDGAIGELAVPLVSSLTGRASAAYATAPEGRRAAQGSLGLGWSPARFLEVSAEVGLARNGGVAGGAAPAGPPLGLAVLGESDPQGSRKNITERTVLLGFRAMFP